MSMGFTIGVSVGVLFRFSFFTGIVAGRLNRIGFYGKRFLVMAVRVLFFGLSVAATVAMNMRIGFWVRTPTSCNS